MISSDMKLFGQALREAACNVYEKELAECDENASCSKRHRRKMAKIVGIRTEVCMPKSERTRRAAIALLIAATLLLASCTAYVCLEKLRNFIVTILDSSIRVTYDEEEVPAVCALEKYYTLTYVPEGYHLVSEVERSSFVKYRWETDSGQYLVFVQRILDSTSFRIDSEQGATEIFEIGGYRVYYRELEKKGYIWTDGSCAMSLNVSEKLTEEELTRIIEGVSAK